MESASTVTLCLEFIVLTLSCLKQEFPVSHSPQPAKKRPSQPRRLHLSRIDRCRGKASHDRLKHFVVPLNSHRGLVDLGVYALSFFLNSSRRVLQCSRQTAFLGRDRLDRSLSPSRLSESCTFPPASEKLHRGPRVGLCCSCSPAPGALAGLIRDPLSARAPDCPAW